MASMITRRAHAGRAPAVKAAALRRSTPAGPVKRYANASYSYPPATARGTSEVVTPLPTGSKALAGAFIAVGVALFAVIGVLVFKYRKTQARKSALFSKYLWVQQPNEKMAPTYSEKSSFNAIYGFGITKPEPALHHGESTSPRSGKWVPQLRADIAIPPVAPRTSKAKEAWEKNLAKFLTPKKNAYAAPEDPNAVEIPIMRVMPPMPNSADKPAVVVLPPTPMKPSSAESSPVTPDSRSRLLSPRSASFANQVSQNLLTVDSARIPAVPTMPMSDKPAQNKKVPRLMTVTTTFTPSLADELSITLDETVRLIEEYADEWCLVQRVGKVDEVKGVIPRFCISERKEMVPRLPHMGRKPSA